MHFAARLNEGKKMPYMFTAFGRIAFGETEGEARQAWVGENPGHGGLAGKAPVSFRSRGGRVVRRVVKSSLTGETVFVETATAEVFRFGGSGISSDYWIEPA